jgi:hypothetical protein
MKLPKIPKAFLEAGKERITAKGGDVILVFKYNIRHTN